MGKKDKHAKAAARNREPDSRADGADLPNDRSELLALHQAARHRRDAAPLLSEERAEAAEEIARLEIHIARIERAMDPPLV